MFAALKHTILCLDPQTLALALLSLDSVKYW